MSGTGRLALGRSSLPWQLRLQSAARRGGGHQQAIGGRLALPLATLQANAGLGLIRQGVAGWQGGATLGMAATHVVRGVTDFEGYVLFEGLPFGRYSVEAAGQSWADIALSRNEPNRQISVLLPPPTN
jgi:hypothetical protein